MSAREFEEHLSPSQKLRLRRARRHIRRGRSATEELSRAAYVMMRSLTELLESDQAAESAAAVEERPNVIIR